MNATNLDIRCAMVAANVRQWQVAEAMGIADSYLCRLLRHELPEDKKQRIYSAIDSLKREAKQ